MALTLPNLDDRRWLDLVDEGRALVPFYAPEWTDHNASDPGITLIELFAWIAEMDLYSVNRITDAIRRKLLALAGVSPEPPHAATSVLQLDLVDGATAIALPNGIEFAGHDPFGVEVRFRSCHEMTARPGRIATVAATVGSAWRDLTTPWQAREPIMPFGDDPSAGSAFCLGLDLPAAAPHEVTSLSLGFVVGEREGASSRDERFRIQSERARAAVDCEPPWTVSPCSCGACDSRPVPADASAAATLGDQDQPLPELADHDVRLVWEVATAPGSWRHLAAGSEVVDGTRAMTLDGRVVVSLEDATPVALAGGDARVWIRARIARGAYDAAPILRGLAWNAVGIVQSVPAVVTARIAAGTQVGGAPPAPDTPAQFDVALDEAGEIDRLDFAAAHTGPAVRVLEFDGNERSLTLEAAALLPGTGAPCQTIVIEDAPVDAGSLRVQSIEDGEWQTWTARPDFDASSRADSHYVAEPSAGTVRLGDGEHGRTARPGTTIVVAANRTRAEGGNLSAQSIDALADSRHNRAVIPDLDEVAQQFAAITNPVAASGGAAAESLDAAIARAREEREQSGRAVTLADHVALAMATPGVRLARAEARANFHPGFPCLTAPGVVTVLVLPYLPADRPEPSPGLRHAVATYLDRRRIVGSRIEIAGPVYVTVTVRAAVEAMPGTRPADVQTAIGTALDAFFHPLRGGPDGIGWPFGRDVYRSEVLHVIDDVPGVAHVVTLELADGDGDPTCGNVCVGPTGLVDSGAHEIEVR